MKSTVVRLSKGEKQIIDLLRNPRFKAYLLNDMNELMEQGIYKPTFRTLLDFVEGPELNRFANLIKAKFLSEAQADILKNAIDQNKNIIITGGIGTGKTTLLNTLFNYQYQSNPLIKTAINDQYNEIILDTEDVHALCFYEKSQSVSMQLLTNLIQSEAEYKRLILSECLQSSDIMAIQFGLSHSCSILTTCHLNPLTDSHMKDLISKFVVVKLDCKDGHRFVNDINIS